MFCSHLRTGERLDPGAAQLARFARLPRFLRRLYALYVRYIRRDPLWAELLRSFGPLSVGEQWAWVGRREAYRAAWHAWWEARGYDFVLAAPNATPAVPHGAMRDAVSSCGYTFLFNLVRAAPCRARPAVLTCPAGVAAREVRVGWERCADSGRAARLHRGRGAGHARRSRARRAAGGLSAPRAERGRAGRVSALRRRQDARPAGRDPDRRAAPRGGEGPCMVRARRGRPECCRTRLQVTGGFRLIAPHSSSCAECRRSVTNRLFILGSIIGVTGVLRSGPSAFVHKVCFT